MEERIASFADIDTRRAMGFPPRKLPPSDLVIKRGRIWYNVGVPIYVVDLENYVSVAASAYGHILWKHGSRYYDHWRPVYAESAHVISL